MICFVSTHLDDAVLSSGQAIADAADPVVVTVFTGAPPIERTDGWNHATTGQSFAPDSQAIRRNEDAAALDVLGARHRWLGLHEAEYRPEGQDPDVLVEALGACLREIAPTEIVIPLGLRHPDHIAVADACLRLIGHVDTRWRIALDLPYARAFPELVNERLATARAGGIRLVACEPVIVRGATKSDAVRCYTTQIDAVRGEHPELDASMRHPERSWWAEPSPGTASGSLASTVT